MNTEEQIEQAKPKFIDTKDAIDFLEDEAREIEHSIYQELYKPDNGIHKTTGYSPWICTKQTRDQFERIFPNAVSKMKEEIHSEIKSIAGDRKVVINIDLETRGVWGDIFRYKYTIMVIK